MTRRRWVADKWDEQTASLEGEQANHLVRVLRAQTGMEFDVIAGENVWRASVANISRDAVTLKLLRRVEADPPLPVILLFSVFKFDRLEWMVEKATELGVQSLVPMIARRTEKHLAQKAPARVDRWRRIAREAAKQSRRAQVPQVRDVVGWREASHCGDFFTGESGGEESLRERSSSLRLFLAEQDQRATQRATLRETVERQWMPHAKDLQPAVVLAVGPEGGWTDEEAGCFAEEGWLAVTLGPRVLRAETAAIAAVAVLAALLP